MKNRIISKLNPIDFGALVEEINEEWGLTLPDLAEATGIRLSYLKELKSGSKVHDELNMAVHLLTAWCVVTNEKYPPFYKR